MNNIYRDLKPIRYSIHTLNRELDICDKINRKMKKKIMNIVYFIYCSAGLKKIKVQLIKQSQHRHFQYNTKI